MPSTINELEEKLQQAEKLAYVGQMTSKLAHELRNPLNTISINLQLLEEHLDFTKQDVSMEQLTDLKIDCDQMLRWIKVSRHEIQRLEHLLSNFLRFAKSVSSQPQPSDINITIRNVVEFIIPAAKQAKVEIVTQLAPDLPKVNIDIQLMKSALLNLILNAIDAMPDGGTLTMRTAMKKPGQSPSEKDRHNPEQVQIIIQDTGLGIPPDKLDKVFEVFYTTKENGSGLGLSIAKRIISDVHGTIELTSEVGKGTTVSITLPEVAS
jgi:signal transduction histidine kinase